MYTIKLFVKVQNVTKSFLTKKLWYQNLPQLPENMEKVYVVLKHILSYLDQIWYKLWEIKSLWSQNPEA